MRVSWGLFELLDATTLEASYRDQSISFWLLPGPRSQTWVCNESPEELAQIQMLCPPERRSRWGPGPGIFSNFTGGADAVGRGAML